MSWYYGFYGKWTEPEGVISIRGSYDRKEIFERAQKKANETGKKVTVIRDRPTGHGLESETYYFKPEEAAQ